MNIDEFIKELRSNSKSGPAAFDISKRPGRKYWCLRIFLDDRKELIRSLGTTDARQAKAIEAEIRSRLNRLATTGIVPRETEDFLDEWLAAKEKEVFLNSWKRYQVVVDKALSFLPPEIFMTTETHIERYRGWLLAEGYKPQTILLEINTLSQVFHRARQLGYIEANPCSDMKRPAKPKTEVEPYTDTELTAIFAELDRRRMAGLRDQCMEAWEVYCEIFHCLNFTGLRIGDALNLKWENVNLKFSSIKITQIKTGKEAIIRIPSAFRARLENMAAKIEGKPSGFVFTNTAGHKITYTRMDVGIRTVLKACGLKKKSPLHSFRHTAARRMLGAGIPIHVVANQLGDTVETIVRSYIKPELPTLADIDHVYRQVSGQSQDIAIRTEGSSPDHKPFCGSPCTAKIIFPGNTNAPQGKTISAQPCVVSSTSPLLFTVK